MTEIKVAVFQVGGQEFAADVRNVREVIATPDVTPLPKARSPVAGIFNLRGNIVTALDGAGALGVGSNGKVASRAIVADAEGKLVALLVDAASEVLTARTEDLRQPPALGASDGVTRGVILHGDRAIVLIDVARLMSRSRNEASADVPIREEMMQ